MSKLQAVQNHITSDAKKPKVSVIMPAYNRAAYIGEAIQSVLEQNFRDFELLVVDDGSTDETEKVVRDFQDKRVRYFYQENGGISAAMNTGIRNARGAYIARLDSDDIWLQDMLNTLINTLTTRPEISWAYASTTAMDKYGVPLPEIRGLPEKYPGDSLKSMLSEDFTCSITTVVCKGCFEHVGLFDRSVNPNEDWEMGFRLVKHFKFAFIDRVVAKFRYHPENTTVGKKSPHIKVHLDERHKVLDKIFNEFGLAPEIAALKPLAYSNLHIWAGRRWIGLKAYRKVFHHFGQAVKISTNPIFTFTQICWDILVDNFFWRYAWGRQFTVKLADFRRRTRSIKIRS